MSRLPALINEEDEMDLTRGLEITSSGRIAPKQKVLFEAFSKQIEFIQAALSGHFRYLVYGGAIRSGKTYVGIALLIMLCRMFPGSRWIIVRATNGSLQRNVIPVFFKICPKNFIQVYNKTLNSVVFINGSEIIFFAEQAEDDPEMQRWHGLEFNGGLLEEGQELREQTFYKFQERMGSWFMDKMPPMVCLITCNPNQGWIKNMFYTPSQSVDDNGESMLKAPYHFTFAKITDNPHVPKSFLEKLKDMPKELYDIFVEGSWDAVDEDHQLISWTFIHKCAELIPVSDELKHANPKMYANRYMGIDVGWEGNDPTVWTIMEGPNIVDIIKRDKSSGPECCEETIQHILNYGVPVENCGIDGVGIGAIVADFLHKAGYPVVRLIGGATPEELVYEADLNIFEFFNLRAQMAWQLKLDYERANIGGGINQRLKDDIGAIKYEIRSEKKIKLLGKDEFKIKLGRSPDFFDSLMCANWMRNMAKYSASPGFFVG